MIIGGCEDGGGAGGGAGLAGGGFIGCDLTLLVEAEDEDRDVDVDVDDVALLVASKLYELVLVAELLSSAKNLIGVLIMGILRSGLSSKITQQQLPQTITTNRVSTTRIIRRRRLCCCSDIALV